MVAVIDRWIGIVVSMGEVIMFVPTHKGTYICIVFNQILSTLAYLPWVPPEVGHEVEVDDAHVWALERAGLVFGYRCV